jgi:hypothetical protein
MKEPIMKKLSLLAYPLVALMSLAAVGVAFAEDGTVDNTARTVFAHPKTRAQVQQELAQARADGTINLWKTWYNPYAGTQSVRSRDEVKAEGREAVRSGSDRTWYGEDSGSFALTALATAKTRRQ